MPLTTGQKALLTAKRTTIQTSFARFTGIRRYMAIYFTKVNEPYITFSNTNNFQATIQIGRNLSVLVGVLDTTQNFTTQVNALLA